MLRVLVLGVTGMLGHMLFKVLGDDSRYETVGAMRSASGRRYFSAQQQELLIEGFDAEDSDALVRVLQWARPDVVVNCVGIIKQQSNAEDPLQVLPINALFPHRLARLCALSGTRVIHVSTDCVFSGRDGGYTEESVSDAEDLYGKSKYIGELHDFDNAVTLRTSIIGHELNSQRSLIDWFLAQEGRTKGYAQAIFSGLPTIELANVIRDHVLTQPELKGLYHVAAEPISKLDLLSLVACEYGKNIEIIEDRQVCIDRSLQALRFGSATGYIAPSWPELVGRMHAGRKYLQSV
ncbi:dTDP-4-dehydrorhamnose reductase [Pseudomonas fluvialis]|uniref:dTDP-4-dehydrorhamnose reductase n=1 Tax=Pseudomonas fluvialis TaxID=1793966 RepID=A0A7X0EUQ1_9PSED|nr:dTDP-4-dehydrorhamnose reductase [Pseudomonas fluvialis]